MIGTALNKAEMTKVYVLIIQAGELDGSLM